MKYGENLEILFALETFTTMCSVYLFVMSNIAENPISHKYQGECYINEVIHELSANKIIDSKFIKYVCLFNAFLWTT